MVVVAETRPVGRGPEPWAVAQQAQTPMGEQLGERKTPLAREEAAAVNCKVAIQPATVVVVVVGITVEALALTNLAETIQEEPGAVVLWLPRAQSIQYL